MCSHWTHVGWWQRCNMTSDLKSECNKRHEKRHLTLNLNIYDIIIKASEGIVTDSQKCKTLSLHDVKGKLYLSCKSLFNNCEWRLKWRMKLFSRYCEHENKWVYFLKLWNYSLKKKNLRLPCMNCVVGRAEIFRRLTKK